MLSYSGKSQNCYLPKFGMVTLSTGSSQEVLAAALAANVEGISQEAPASMPEPEVVINKTKIVNNQTNEQSNRISESLPEKTDATSTEQPSESTGEY